MASACTAISTFSICKTTASFCRRSGLPFQSLRFHNQLAIPVSFSPASSCSLSVFKRSRSIQFSSFLTAEDESLAAGDEANVAATQQQEDEPSAASASILIDQTVSVTVSPSDVLTMFFQAEGTMSEAAIPTMTQALEESEGIADLRVQVLEGIASVELTKQTTVQATGVASNLVEIIQSKGFKLQTLNLSFQDEEDLN